MCIFACWTVDFVCVCAFFGAFRTLIKCYIPVLILNSSSLLFFCLVFFLEISTVVDLDLYCIFLQCIYQKERKTKSMLIEILLLSWFFLVKDNQLATCGFRRFYWLSLVILLRCVFWSRFIYQNTNSNRNIYAKFGVCFTLRRIPFAHESYWINYDFSPTTWRDTHTHSFFDLVFQFVSMVFRNFIEFDICHDICVHRIQWFPNKICWVAI